MFGAVSCESLEKSVQPEYEAEITDDGAGASGHLRRAGFHGKAAILFRESRIEPAKPKRIFSRLLSEKHKLPMTVWSIKVPEIRW